MFNLAKGNNMPDKIQHTAAKLHERMEARYGDGLHHKHNKHHLEYRKHFRSHPCNQRNNIEDEEETLNGGSTGLLRELKLKKMRKRRDRGQFH